MKKKNLFSFFNNGCYILNLLSTNIFCVRVSQVSHAPLENLPEGSLCGRRIKDKGLGMIFFSYLLLFVCLALTPFNACGCAETQIQCINPFCSSTLSLPLYNFFQGLRISCISIDRNWKAVPFCCGISLAPLHCNSRNDVQVVSQIADLTSAHSESERKKQSHHWRWR